MHSRLKRDNSFSAVLCGSCHMSFTTPDSQSSPLMPSLQLFSLYHTFPSLPFTLRPWYRSTHERDEPVAVSQSNASGLITIHQQSQQTTPLLPPLLSPFLPGMLYSNCGEALVGSPARLMIAHHFRLNRIPVRGHRAFKRVREAISRQRLLQHVYRNTY